MAFSRRVRGWAATAATVCLAPCICGTAVAQPNIIHIIADDLGWTDLSSGRTNKGNGSAFYETPNIDRLAEEGMAFTSAYAAQTCVPTRVALMTGQYATRTGVYNVQSLQGSDNSLLVGADNNTNIDTAATTIGETLQAAGYTTAHFGKFHTTQRASQITTAHGFDFNYGGGTSGGPGSYFAAANNQFGGSVGAELDAYAAPYTQAYVDANLRPFANGADVDSLVGTAKHLTDATTDAAIDFIGDRVVADDGPFYMNVAFNAVHTPIESRPDLEAKYAGVLAGNGDASPDPRHDDAGFAGLLEGMDQAIGRLLARLDDPNGDGDSADSIAGDTILFFYGDNGGALQATDNTPLRDGKGSQYEGGVRVPLIAWAPGRVQEGAIRDDPVHAIDFYPTFAELAGADLPNAASQPLDGESLVGLLEGRTDATERDALYSHFPGYQGQSVPTSVALVNIGNQRRKLMYFYEGRSFEFYDLNNDLGESNDLADGPMAPNEYKLAARAAVGLREWLDATGAIFPTVRADGADVPPPQHLPAIPFDLGADLDGATSASIELLGVGLTLTAVGESASLDATNAGVGVASSLDAGGQQQRRRINGSLAAPEAIEISFDTDVMLKSLTLSGVNTTEAESIVLSFVSGDNPFTGLVGYDTDGFALADGSLLFDGSAADGGNFTLTFGDLGRDELLLTAGTIVSLTADPASAGGILLSEIVVAQPLSAAALVAVDYNLDGEVGVDDFDVWRDTFGSTTDLRADGNGNGRVDAADYTIWRDAYDAGRSAVAAPEPRSWLMLIGCLATVLHQRSNFRGARVHGHALSPYRREKARPNAITREAADHRA